MPKPSKTEIDETENVEEESEYDSESDQVDDDENYQEEPEEDDDMVIDTDDEIEDNNEEIKVDKKDRITRPFLTKYEKVRIIGTRRKQLYLGAKPMIKIDGDISIEDIVDFELKEKVIPFKIKRPLPNSKKVEVWDLSELEIIN